jgi:ankyrin repeat protein
MSNPGLEISKTFSGGGSGGGGDSAIVRSHLLSPTSPAVTFFDPAIITAFSDAVEHERNDVVRNLLRKYSDLANSDLNSGKRPLSVAIEKNSSEICGDLLAAGARSDYVMPDGFRPLHKAAMNGNVKIVKLLLAFGADIDAVVCESLTVEDCVSGADVYAITAFLELPEEEREKQCKKIREEVLREFKRGVVLVAPRAERVVDVKDEIWK